MYIQQHQHRSAYNCNECRAQEIFQVFQRNFLLLFGYRLGQGNAIGPEQPLIQNGKQRNIQQRRVGIQLHHQRNAHKAHVAEHYNGAEHMPPISFEMKYLFQSHRQEKQHQIQCDGKGDNQKALRQALPRGALGSVNEDVRRQRHPHDQLGHAAQGMLVQNSKAHCHNAQNNKDQKDPDLIEYNKKLFHNFSLFFASLLGQYRIIRQGDLAWNFASQICCENAGILCVFQIFAADL